MASGSTLLMLKAARSFEADVVPEISANCSVYIHIFEGIWL